MSLLVIDVKDGHLVTAALVQQELACRLMDEHGLIVHHLDERTVSDMVLDSLFTGDDAVGCIFIGLGEQGGELCDVHRPSRHTQEADDSGQQAHLPFFDPFEDLRVGLR